MATSAARTIREAAERFSDDLALRELASRAGDGICEGRRVTYGQLFDLTLRLCAGLDARGLRKGDRVAVLLDNSIELVVTEWACVTAGYVWVALNTRAASQEIRAILDDSRPSILIVSRRHAGQLPDVLAPGCRRIDLPEGWDELVSGARDAPVPQEPSAEDPVRIRYTSGTAGKPKGAVLPRRSYDASVEAVSAVLRPLRRGDVLLQVAPMTHAAGAMLLPHLAVGGSALLEDRFEAKVFIEIVERYRATAVFLVPTMLIRVLDVLDEPSRLASLRSIVYGGASMPVEPLMGALERLGPMFVQIYGLTESTWPVTALPRADHVRRADEDDRSWRARLASCGKPTAVGEVRIVDEGGVDVPTGQVGELWVRGRNTMSRYWSRPGKETEADAKGIDRQGWMHTGDLGRVDDEGYVTIVDRLHDMIVSGGFNVYPREVEDALCDHPAVLEAAVVGRPSPEWGETVHAVVVLRPGAHVSEPELVAHCAQRLAGYKKPRSLEIVERLPRNPSGKILRRALR